MASVSDLLYPDFARSWHEAVAVVQEIASRLSPGLAMPAPEDLYLDEAGEISLGFGSEASGTTVCSLARLLLDLLEGIDAPEGLRQLGRENAAAPPAHGTTEGFVRALDFYERPNRQVDLQAIGSRANGPGAGRAQPEFAWLRDRAAQAAEAAEEPVAAEVTAAADVAPRPVLTPGQRQRAVMAGATAALVLIAVAGVSRINSTTPGAIDRAAARLSSLMAAAVSAVGGAEAEGAAAPTGPADTGSPTGAAVAAPAEATPAAPAEAPLPHAEERAHAPTPAPGGGAVPVAAGRRALPSARRPIAEAAPLPSRRAASSAVVSVTPVPLPWTAPMLPDPIGAPADLPAGPAAVPAPARAPGDPGGPAPPGIYTSADPQVRPPVFLRPQLPREPAPGDDTGYFDIVVNELGDVEQVKLLSPVRRFQERMMMAAAKAWKFEPARLDGRPVKYRMRVPIIIKGMP